jgi:phage protein D
MTEPLLSSSAPVFKVDGERSGELARDLLGLAVEETTRGLKTLRASFVAIGPSPGGEAEQLQYLDGSLLDFGKRLEVSLGPAGEERVVFEGLISALEGGFEDARPPEVVVFAEDDLMKLRMTRRMRTYEQVSDADIAAAIASEHGLTPSADADGPTYDVVQQINQSDLAFLRDRADRVQAELWCDGGTLHFATRPNRTATSLTLVNGNELASVRCRADLAHQRSKVKVSGYDAAQRAAIEEEAGSDAVQAETSGGQSGPAVLDRALGERISYRVREAPLVSAEARAWATAEMLRRARSFVTVTGSTHGSPSLVVGSRVTLERVGQVFEGDGWYVTRVRHTYDLAHGHRTRFEAERPTLGTAS